MTPFGGGLPLALHGVTAASGLRGPTGAWPLLALVAGLAALGCFAVRCVRRSSPLLDVRLFCDRIFGAAAVTVLLVGASFYGGLVIGPLYLEQFRHLGVVTTGLLLLAYGGGAGLSMRAGGRLTDRFGGGIVATGGLLICGAATLPFAFLGPHAGLVLVEGLQVVQGIGIGLAGMPAMSAAYAVVAAGRLGDATAQVDILQRVGGALGTTLLVLCLEDLGAPGVRAFQTTFAWLTAVSAAAAFAAAWLALTQRRRRRAGSAPAGG